MHCESRPCLFVALIREEVVETQEESERVGIEIERERANKRTAKYLLGMPLLADWLEEGLEAIGA